MAARDAQETIGDALQSLREQTLSARDVLVVLNGCQDKTKDVVKSFAKDWPELKFFETPAEGGVALAVKEGCKQAQGEFIVRMDADDVCEANRFAVQVEVINREQADLVTSRVEVLDAIGAGLKEYVGWANRLLQSEDFARERFIESPVIQPSVMMRRESYQLAGGYRVESGPEDYELWLRMLSKGMRFHQASETTLYWRDSMERLTRTHEDYSKVAMASVRARYLAFLPQVRERGVTLAGAGPTGRRLAKLLKSEGVQVRGFYDVNPKWIGRQIYGLPVWGPSQLGVRFEEEQVPVLLGCVGHAGRERVRALVKGVGYREGVDFFACC